MYAGIGAAAAAASNQAESADDDRAVSSALKRKAQQRTAHKMTKQKPGSESTLVHLFAGCLCGTSSNQPG